MLTVCTIEVGNYLGRGVEYVACLHDGVRRNLPEGFGGRFVVLTDRPEAYQGMAGVEAYHIPGPQNWFAKLQLFAPLSGLFKPQERVLYFDLDTVITGKLDDIASYNGAFALLHDVYRPKGFQSSVMAFMAHTNLVQAIWDEWSKRGRPMPPGGDQTVLESFWGEWNPARMMVAPHQVWQPDFLQELYPGAFRSYKADCVWSIPAGTRVVFFHGVPRPHEVQTGWVPEAWKVGGGTSVELVTVGTVAQDTLLSNLKANLDVPALAYDQVIHREAHERMAVIVGGGPSVKDYLAVIANLRNSGAELFACNQVYHYLAEHRIVAQYHVMLDGRPELAEWVAPARDPAGATVRLYASIMDPKVLRLAREAGPTRIWHPYTGGVPEIVGDGLMVGGGGTVGVRSMALAFAMGYRKFLVFGLDSSYRDGEHHAYAQALNDGEQVLDAVIAGKRFKAAAWMIEQAEQFKDLALQMKQAGADISVMCEGLLSAMIESMSDEITQIDGLFWPSQDTETRGSVLETLKDLEHYVGECAQRRTVVQAGGNVGVWPKALAPYFNRVVTFEPDPVNFTCLKRNVSEPNIEIHESGLGQQHTTASVIREATNCGASALGVGDEVPVLPLDSLELADVDLLQLDVEGHEFQALKGAKNTIERCSPLIVLELKGLGKRYGYEDSDVERWLYGLGYERVGVAHRDVIFKRKSA